MTWAESWNNHKISTPGLGNKSPAEMKYVDTLLHGGRGFPPISDEPEEMEDVAEYGIDWDAYDDARLRAHHTAQNTPDGFGEDALVHADNPFVMHAPTPDSMNEVVVDEPGCPFSTDQVARLDEYLQQQPYDRSSPARVNLWSHALHYCRDILAANTPVM